MKLTVDGKLSLPLLNTRDKFSNYNKMKNEAEKINNPQGNGNDFISDVVCCGYLEQLNINWMHLGDQTKCMPHIKNIQEDKEFRVNYCPVCGKNVRGAMI